MSPASRRMSGRCCFTMLAIIARPPAPFSGRMWPWMSFVCMMTTCVCVAPLKASAASSSVVPSKVDRSVRRLVILGLPCVLLPYHVPGVFVVLFADTVAQVRIRYQTPHELHIPRLRIRLRIVNRDLDFHLPDFRPRETFDDPQRLGSRQTFHIEPGLAVLSDGLHDKRVLLPVADRISHPCGLRIFR